MVQVAHGERVTNRLTFRFRDGSLDDETTIFTHHGNFQLVSDHHIQRGPSYPKPIDMLVEANGNVTLRQGEGADAKLTTDHIDLPPDTYNGLQFTLMTNLAPNAAETRFAMVLPTGKGRLVHLSIKPIGEDPVTIGFAHRKAQHFQVHVELGGVAAVVAPVIGKEPKDIQVWVLEGEAPAIVKAEAQLYEGGPVWRIEQTAPGFPGEK